MVVLLDDMEKRIYLPELKGACSASFLPLVDMGSLKKADLPVLPQGNGRCGALDDVLHAALTTMYTQQIEIGADDKLTVVRGSQDIICKFSNMQ